MSLRISDNVYMTLDDESRKAYVLSGAILAQREGSFMHAGSLHSFITRKYPNLQIDYNTTTDILHSLVKDGALTREVSEHDDPTYHFNPDYLFKIKK